MKKFIILAMFASFGILGACAETAVVPADAIVCSKASGCS